MPHGMVDIHSHVLPRLDDGAKDLRSSLEMVNCESCGGTSVIFATPHIYGLGERGLLAGLADRVASLQSEIDSRGIPVRIVQGAEVFPSFDLVEAIDRDLPVTLGKNGRYVLIDTPLTSFPAYLDRLVVSVRARGVTPILAHPERSLQIQQDPYLVTTLLDYGVLVQLDAGSVLGNYGRAAARTADAILRRRHAHFIASDAHGTQRGRPLLASCVAKLRRSLPPETISELVVANGLRVIEGLRISATPSTDTVLPSCGRMTVKTTR